LRDSRFWLEDVVGKAVTVIAYPHGAVDQRVCEAAAHAGYTLGVCSQSGINAVGRNPLLLRRTEILAEDGLRVFRQKIEGAWDWHRFRHCDPAGVR